MSDIAFNPNKNHRFFKVGSDQYLFSSADRIGSRWATGIFNKAAASKYIPLSKRCLHKSSSLLWVAHTERKTTSVPMFSDGKREVNNKRRPRNLPFKITLLAQQNETQLGNNELHKQNISKTRSHGRTFRISVCHGHRHPGK